MLRNTSAADDELCWGNVSLLPESQARACGFTTEATLCKKHYDEKNQKNKLKCCFPLRDDQDCHRNLVSCPKRLFPVFDCLGKNLNTGTFICEAHLKLADEDKRICDNGAYTPPKKVRHSHLLILHSPGILLCATKPFVDVWDNPIPAHRHTPSHRFICLTSAQGHNQPTARVQTLTGVNFWEKLSNLKMAKKNWKKNKEKQKKKTHSWWKKLKVCETVTMKEICLATKDRTWNYITCCFDGMQNKL